MTCVNGNGFERALGALVLLVACSGAAHSSSSDDARGGTHAGHAGAAGLTSADGGVATAGGIGGRASAGAPIGVSPPMLSPLCFDPARASACVDTANGLSWTGIELANALDLKGSGSHFVDVGGLAALLVSANGDPSVVVASASGTRPVQVLGVDLSAALPDLEIRSVWAPNPAMNEFGFEVVAVGCGAGGCQLFGARWGELNLRLVEGLDLPAGAVVDRLSAGRGEYQLCAYGKGLYCLERDGWKVVIAGELGQVIAAYADECAVWSNGSIFLLTSTGSTSGPFPLSTATYVAAFTRAVHVLDGVGSWFIASRENASEASALCRMSPSPLAVTQLSNGQGLVFLSNGASYAQRTDTNEWCQLSMGGPTDLIRLDAHSCGLSTNVLAISERSFYSLNGEVG